MIGTAALFRDVAASKIAALHKTDIGGCSPGVKERLCAAQSTGRMLPPGHRTSRIPDRGHSTCNGRGRPSAFTATSTNSEAVTLTRAPWSWRKTQASTATTIEVRRGSRDVGVDAHNIPDLHRLGSRRRASFSSGAKYGRAAAGRKSGSLARLHIATQARLYIATQG